MTSVDDTATAPDLPPVRFRPRLVLALLAVVAVVVIWISVAVLTARHTQIVSN